MKFLILSLLLVAAVSAVTRYDGYEVIRVHPRSAVQLGFVQSLENSGKYDFWKSPSENGFADIMASGKDLLALKASLKLTGTPFTTFIDDVQRKLEYVESIPKVQAGPRSSKYALTWDNYYRFNVIQEFCNALAQDYPDLVTLEVVGQSYEGRDMILVKISSGGDGKPGIFVDGGIHAREWISPATVTYMMRELVENYASHPEVVDNVDWYFMPLINPDGYEYSHTDSRLWRKTRSPTTIGSCKGADPNRNWDFHWAEGGTSSNPCSEIYTGPSPFSEVEMAAVSDAILARASQLKLYLTIHSYGQMLLVPWGYDAVLPPDYTDLENLGLAATDALTAVRGTRYDVGCSGIIYGAAAGASDDWNKGVANIKYSYTLELPDNGFYGFVLPPSQILPVATETWEAFKTFAAGIAGAK